MRTHTTTAHTCVDSIAQPARGCSRGRRAVPRGLRARRPSRQRSRRTNCSSICSVPPAWRTGLLGPQRVVRHCGARAPRTQSRWCITRMWGCWARLSPSRSYALSVTWNQEQPPCRKSLASSDDHRGLPDKPHTAIHQRATAAPLSTDQKIDSRSPDARAVVGGGGVQPAPQALQHQI